MGNRILKESICRSDEIDALSWFEEVLFYRLIVSCDDFGRFDGRTKIIKGTCFPLKSVTEKDIDKAVNKLSAVGLVRVYQVQGRPYLQLATWNCHQTIRNQKSKYPNPEEALDTKKNKKEWNEFANSCKQLQTIENNCNQLKSIAINCVPNPIQIQSEFKSESECMLRAKAVGAGSICRIINDYFAVKYRGRIPHYTKKYRAMGRIVSCCERIAGVEKNERLADEPPQKKKNKKGNIRLCKQLAGKRTGQRRKQRKWKK